MGRNSQQGRCLVSEWKDDYKRYWQACCRRGVLFVTQYGLEIEEAGQLYEQWETLNDGQRHAATAKVYALLRRPCNDPCIVLRGGSINVAGTIRKFLEMYSEYAKESGPNLA